jgi:hypothetical protein
VSIPPVTAQVELRTEMATGDVKGDLACEIDKLDYLQVIPECRDEPVAMAPVEANADLACEIDKLDYLQVIPECRDEPVATAPVEADAKICDVSGFRMFKGNLPQWRATWTADGTTSWETFEKLDSESIRHRALEIQMMDQIQAATQ